MGMGKTIEGETRTVILRVMAFFENEKANKRILIPVDQAIKRTCAATGVSKTTLMKIKRECKKALQSDPPAPSTSSSWLGTTPLPELPTPGKNRKPHSKKIELDHFELCALQELVKNFYKVRKEKPTLNKILAAAKSELNFKGGKSTLRLILAKRLHYKFKKTENGTPILIQEDESENECSDTMLKEEKINCDSD